MFTLTRPRPGAPLSKCEYVSGDWTIDYSLKRPEGSLWRIKYQGVVMDYAPTLAKARERTNSILSPDFVRWVESL